MANHHGTQSGFHPSPPCRQPLCSGGASQEQLWTHTRHSTANKGQRHALPGTSSRDGALRPCRRPADAQAEQAGGDATSPGGLPMPGLQQRCIFFPAGGGVPHITPWLLQVSQPAGAPCRYSTATQGRPTQANAPKQGRAYHQRALDFQGGYHRREDKDVPRDTAASMHILEPHPAAGPMHTLPPR